MPTMEQFRDDVQTAVAALTPVIEQHRDEAEQERRLPDAVFATMRDSGLLKLWTPKEYGGSEADITVFMQTVEELSRVDGAAGWVFANLAAGNVLAAHLPEAGAREIYANGASTPLPGSVAPCGRATPVAGGYRVSGRWPLSSGCHHGEWLVVTALVFDGDVPQVGPHGAPNLAQLFVRHDEAQILDTWHSLGLRGTGSTDFAVDDAFVPAHRVFTLFIDPPRVAGPLYRAGILPLYSLALTTVSLGIARAAIDAFVALAKQKTPTLSQTGLAARPTIHAEVAHAEAQLQSARAYLYTVADEIMASVRGGSDVPDELEARRRLACVNAGSVCPAVVNQIFTLAGATPIYTGHPLERCLRDVRTAAQHLAVSPVWWEKTGQFYFGHGLGMP
jgi:indole-3-acetate monooxygenase